MLHKILKLRGYQTTTLRGKFIAANGHISNTENAKKINLGYISRFLEKQPQLKSKACTGKLTLSHAVKHLLKLICAVPKELNHIGTGELIWEKQLGRRQPRVMVKYVIGHQKGCHRKHGVALSLRCPHKIPWMENAQKRRYPVSVRVTSQRCQIRTCRNSATVY